MAANDFERQKDETGDFSHYSTTQHNMLSGSEVSQNPAHVRQLLEKNVQDDLGGLKRSSPNWC